MEKEHYDTTEMRKEADHEMKFFRTKLKTMFDKRSRIETPSHIGTTLQVGKDFNRRCCHKLEKSLSPTIVLKDKRAYQVYCSVDNKKELEKTARI